MGKKEECPLYGRPLYGRFRKKRRGAASNRPAAQLREYGIHAAMKGSSRLSNNQRAFAREVHQMNDDTPLKNQNRVGEWLRHFRTVL
jgi:hypothetical protein